MMQTNTRKMFSPTDNFSSRLSSFIPLQSPLGKSSEEMDSNRYKPIDNLKQAGISSGPVSTNLRESFDEARTVEVGELTRAEFDQII